MTADMLPNEPSRITAVAMQAESGCSRCGRQILTLEKAFLDERYAAVCVSCIERAYNLLATGIYIKRRKLDGTLGPGDMPDA